MVRIVKGTESKFVLHKGSRSKSAPTDVTGAEGASPAKEEAGSAPKAESEGEKMDRQ